jgi:hypothetical protein
MSSQCLTKQKYSDLSVAQRVAENYTVTNYQKRTFRVYKCTICDGYHLSSKKLRSFG